MPNAKITCSSQVYFIVIFPCLPLVQGKPSFSLAKKFSNSTSPAYPWRTVFFAWQRISSFQIIRFMRGKPSFLLVMILATTEDNDKAQLRRTRRQLKRRVRLICLSKKTFYLLSLDIKGVA